MADGKAAGTTAGDGKGEMQIMVGNRRAAQRVPVRGGGWTKKRREQFLRVLAETCNVSAATRALGPGAPNPYLLRRRDPAFASLWEEALQLGYDRLETLLLERALEGVNAIDVAALVGAADEEDAAARRRPLVPGSNVTRTGARGDLQFALALLNRRAAGAHPAPRRTMSSDEVDALLMKRLDALARKRGA